MKIKKVEKNSWETFKKVSKYLIPICLILVIGISILIIILSFKKKKTAKEIVNEMGIGWNLGNTFDCFEKSKIFNSPDDQITVWGNTIPTKKMIHRIKKYGFKTIRLPVTWMHFIDESGNVNSDWMSRVKEVAKWIIKDKMYCILNVHHDGAEGNWLSEGLKVKNKYINLWSQIATEFKNFNEYLIFESMNEVVFYIGDKYDYLTLLGLNQIFIDTVRNSGGKNGDRLLLIAGMDGNADLTCSSEYVLPIDPINKFGVSFNYYIPERFTLEKESAPWTYEIDNITYVIEPMIHWGNKDHYEEMFNNFENIKKVFLDKQIPVIINEVGVLTEEKKESKSIREFLFAAFAITTDYDGIMTCLWDTSKKGAGDMNFYDKENNRWYDEKIRDYLTKIIKREYVKPTEYYILSNQETVYNNDSYGNMVINIENKKANRAVVNILVRGIDYKSIVLGIASRNKDRIWIGEGITGNEGRKQDDGSYTFFIDIKDKDYNEFIQVERWWGQDYITFKYFTIIYDKEYADFNYIEYKNAISNYI